MQKTLTYRSSRAAVALMVAASSMPVIITAASAGEGESSLSPLAQREMVRRQQAVTEADALLSEGRAAYAKGDSQQAVDKYRQALDRLPDAPLVSDRRISVTAHLSDASLALAMQQRKVGKYTEARALLEELLKKDPENAAAKREIGFLEDPIRTNPGLTYEHTQNVDKVRRDLYTAEGNFNLGKYDDARRSYESVLRLDPYNSAARRGLEQVATAKSDYYRAAYDHTRAELLGQVDAAWELTVPAELPKLGSTVFGAGEVTTGVAYITNKLKNILIPRIDFEDTSVEEAIDFLRLRASELDVTETDPAKKGINFVIRRPRPESAAPAAGLEAPAAGAEALPVASDPGALRVRELRVRNVPLAVALKYVCDAAKLRFKVDDYAVTLVPSTESVQDVFTRTFRVPPDFGSALGSGGGEAPAAGPTDPFADAKSGGTAPKLSARAPILDLLKNSGITFGTGSSATLSSSGVLLVTNTPNELDKVEQLVQTISDSKPKQVKITTKFVEIAQENSDELGFDWVVSPFGQSYGNLFGSGGTTGNQPGRTGVDFTAPDIPGVVSAVPGVPTTTDTANVSNIVTAGNRSGDSAVNRNNIDAILNNPTRNQSAPKMAPGIMSLTGLFTDGEVKMIMRGLAQKKGTDLMTAPSVTAKSGQKATIEVIREFIYPTEYDPPQLPTTTGASFGSTTNPLTAATDALTGSSSSGSSFPVTPATPTAFSTRNTGVTLEIEPTIGENDFVVDLRFAPEIVEFEGFINYGSPIVGGGITITENRIEMPVFSSRRVKTQLTVYDGYTVAVGGLMREDVQNVEDKVPILGDIPVIGRLFQSKSENHLKSNLIVFITAQIIDATGRPLRGADAGQTVPVTAGAAAGGGDTGEGVLPPL